MGNLERNTFFFEMSIFIQNEKINFSRKFPMIFPGVSCCHIFGSNIRMCAFNSPITSFTNCVHHFRNNFISFLSLFYVPGKTINSIPPTTCHVCLYLLCCHYKLALHCKKNPILKIFVFKDFFLKITVFFLKVIFYSVQGRLC